MDRNYLLPEQPLIEGYFRRSKPTFFWILTFSIGIVVGGAGILIGIMENQPIIVVVSVLSIVGIGLMGIRQQKRYLVKLIFEDNRLIVKGGGYHIQMKAPFRYETGVQRIRATRRTPEFHYIRMVLDVYGKPLVLEEQVPSGIQPPKLNEIIGLSSALGIAELSSTNRYPGTLWSLIQAFETESNQDKADQIQRDIENLYRIGGQQLDSENYYGAIQTFSEISRLTPESPYPYYNRGISHFYRGHELDKAIRDLTTAIRLNPKLGKAYRMRGLVRAEQGDWAGLRDDCTHAIRLDPDDDELYNIRGGACYRLKDYQSALADFNRAIKLSSINPEPYHNRGLVKHQQGNLDGAIADFRQALTLNPHFELARDSLVLVEQEKKQLGLS